MTPVRIGKAIALIALLVPCARPAAAAEETTISVSANPNPVSERESVQLQVVVDSPLTAVVLEPTFNAPDFIKAGSPEMKFQPHSGDFGPNTRKKLIFTYVLMPRHAGDLAIGNIATKVSGQLFQSPDVHVKVTPDAAGPRPSVSVSPAPVGGAGSADDESSNPAAPGYHGRGSAPTLSRSATPSVPDRFNSDFTVWASPSKTKAYVGEPITVEYYIYDFGGIRQLEILGWPNFTGFWREDLEITTHFDFQEVYVKQQEVRRAFVARYALYGIKPGRYSLDKLGVRAKYAPSDTLSPALIFNMDLRTGQHYSQDVTIDVMPLPEANRPANFGGAVGKFSLKLEADKQTVAQNTPVTFTLTLEGEGNFQAIDSIKLPLPPDFELYEATTSGRQVAPVGARQELASKKTFQTVSIPRKAGHFEIPALTWSYFDPEKSAYETLTTQPMQIEVTPNESTASATNSYLPSGEKGATPPSQDDLRYLKPVDLSSRPRSFDPLTAVLLGLLALNAVLAMRFLRGRSRGLVRLVRGIDRFSEARIALLQAKGIRDAEWQAGLEEVVLMTMQVLLDTNPRGLPRADLEDAWRARNLPAPLFQRASALLDEIDRHRFSSQKLTGSGTKEVRSRLTKETESLLSEASQVGRKR